MLFVDITALLYNLARTKKKKENVKMKKRLFSALLAGILALSLVACGGTTETEEPAAEETTTEASTDFPSETITIVVPFGAGGSTDMGARNMATALQKELGVNVVVENMPGSNGWVAWTEFLNGSYTDGYTISLINHNFVFGALDEANPREYTLDDVQVLTNQVIDYNVMAIRANDDRFSNLEEFIEYAKETPVLIASQAAGVTDGDSTTAEWFNKTYGTQITTVPVDGSSDAVSMFLAGDTDIYFGSIFDVKQYHESGEMNVICVFSEERNDFIPEVPTVEEVTGESFVAFAARGYFYPQGVSAEIVEFMTEAMLKVMEDPEYIEAMNNLGLQLDNTSGDAYKELLQSQMETRLSVWE